MSHRPVRWLLAAALAASACGAIPGAPGGPAGEVLVRWADPAARSGILAELAPGYGARVAGQVAGLGLTVVACRDAARVAARLDADPAVAYAEVVTPLRPAAGGNAPDDGAAGWNLRRIEVEAAWKVTRGSPAVTVAVLDTGVDARLTAFKGRIAAGRDVYAGTSGQTDAHGHGTEVASIAAGAGVGVAPGVRLLPVRVTGADGLASTTSVARGIVYAVDAGARVLNVSLAGPAPSRALQDAVGYARDRGALVVAAAGNEGGDRPTYPAGTPGVLAVAQTTPADELAAGASHGWHVALVAPGTGIVAAKAGGGRGGGGGSSLAAPHVAGVAALLMSAHPAWSADEVRARLLATADDLGPPGVDVDFGHGRVNARRALAGAATDGAAAHGAGR